MGCDIHTYAEFKKDGKWTFSGLVFPSTYFDPKKPANQLDCYVPENPEGSRFVVNYHPDHGQPCTRDCYVNNRDKVEHPYQGRNYDLFAILAGVRNSSEIIPIAEPRGLPPDLCPEIMKLNCITTHGEFHTIPQLKKWVKSGVSRQVEVPWTGDFTVTHPDWHSHSYFTLKELLEYNWDKAYWKEGLVDEQEYRRFKKTGEPSMWCGDTAGKIISNEEMDKIMANQPESEDASLFSYTQGKEVRYTRIQWKVTVRSYCSLFLKDCIPNLQMLGKPEDVRMVFWFDN